MKTAPRRLAPSGGVSVILQFVCDAMLGRVCRWLRLLGYEVYYDPGGSDDSLIEVAEKCGGVLLTRDMHLYRRALRQGVRAFYVENDDFYDQFHKIACEFNLKLEIDPNRSFCPKCGGKVREAGREEVYGLLPPGILEKYKEFWICTSCGKTYWKGFMWKSMKKVLDKVRFKRATGDRENI